METEYPNHVVVLVYRGHYRVAVMEWNEREERYQPKWQGQVHMLEPHANAEAAEKAEALKLELRKV